MIKSAQTKLGGHERVSKRFERATKITIIMMLKTKRRKSPTLGGTMDHFTNQFQGPEIHGPKNNSNDRFSPQQTIVYHHNTTTVSHRQRQHHHRQVSPSPPSLFSSTSAALHYSASEQW
jgi:hypothetical protein